MKRRTQQRNLLRVLSCSIFSPPINLGKSTSLAEDSPARLALYEDRRAQDEAKTPFLANYGTTSDKPTYGDYSLLSGWKAILSSGGSLRRSHEQTDIANKAPQSMTTIRLIRARPQGVNRHYRAETVLVIWRLFRTKSSHTRLTASQLASKLGLPICSTAKALACRSSVRRWLSLRVLQSTAPANTKPVHRSEVSKLPPDIQLRQRQSTDREKFQLQ